MADDVVRLPSDQNIEHHLVTLFEKLENLKNENQQNLCTAKLPIRFEIRTLEFWRSVISECLASFIYVFVVCGAAAGAGVGLSTADHKRVVGEIRPSIFLASALASGFAMTSLTQCFGHISGAHINPAVSVAMGITKKISLLRTIMFVVSQCGGAIAGAAFLYGVTVHDYQTHLSVTFTHSVNEAPWEKFGIEVILSFVVVFSYFVSMDGYKKWMGTSALTIGATYSACSFVSMPYLNPARSLGPSFVFNKWANHWVYWIGPIIGGSTAGVIYEYIFNSKRGKNPKDTNDGDSSSIHSDEDTYDDLDKPQPPKFHGSTYNTYRLTATSNGPSGGYCASLASTNLYSAAPPKMDREESLYGWTKSLYCKSPPLTRANLNRSQSVYTKSNTGVHRDILPKPGPLVPAQSLYPMRLNQQSHVQNQNLQNQMQQRPESIYGLRTGGAGGGGGVNSGGGTSSTNTRSEYRSNYEDNQKNSCSSTTGRRPESMYGMLTSQNRRGQSAQSDDSSYGSYHENNPSTSNYTNFQKTNCNTGTFSRNAGGGTGEPRQGPSNQLLNSANTCQHPQHSPKPQY